MKIPADDIFHFHFFKNKMKLRLTRACIAHLALKYFYDLINFLLLGPLFAPSPKGINFICINLNLLLPSFHLVLQFRRRKFKCD